MRIYQRYGLPARSSRPRRDFSQSSDGFVASTIVRDAFRLNRQLPDSRCHLLLHLWESRAFHGAPGLLQVGAKIWDRHLANGNGKWGLAPKSPQ